jgi:plastocyanin
MQFPTLRVSRPVAPSSAREKSPLRQLLLAPILLVLVVVAWTIVTSLAWTVVSSVARADDAAIATVSIDNFTFTSSNLTVKAGTTVTWTNHDDIPHSIVDKNRKLFRSKVLDTGESFSFTFSNPGSYDYFCGLHPHMTGHIVVES